MTRNEMKTPDGAVAWRYRDAEMRDRDQWHYLDLPPLNDYEEVEPLIPAASLDALRAELEIAIADRDAYEKAVDEIRSWWEETNALAIKMATRAEKAESNLADVGALADSIAVYAGDDDGSRLDRLAAHWSTQLRTLIAEAGTGDNDNTEVTK